jgi:uncharacterized UPF0160 family protein
LNIQKITIAVHSGAFHADDILGAAVLLALYPMAELVRTRNPDKVARATYAVDVGGEWDAARGRFDHHQKGFAHRRADGTTYAAAGLVWSTLGAEYVARTAPHLPSQDVLRVASAVDDQLIRFVDMTDTGEGLGAQGQFGLSLLLANMNLTRAEAGPAGPQDSVAVQARATRQHAAFMEAVSICQSLLSRLVLQLADEVMAEDVVRTSTRELEGKVLELEEAGLSWQQVVHDEMPDVRIVLYPDNTDGGYMLQTVPTEVGGFTPKKQLPAAWAGLRFRDLEAVTHVAGSVFCHNKRFIAGVTTRAGALELAKLALAD